MKEEKSQFEKEVGQKVLLALAMLIFYLYMFFSFTANLKVQ
jgi:hypothetical protein